MAILLFSLGVVILAEALNKLERTAPCAHGLSRRQRVLQWLKGVAWILLALGAAGVIAGPIFGNDLRNFREACMYAGFVVLIVRTRIKEG